MNSEESLLQFVAVSSFVQPSFWNKLSELKINIDKLSDAHRNIWGHFPTSKTWSSHVLEVDSTSFNSTFDVQHNTLPFYGKIFNKNTIEEFKNCDKTNLINSEGRNFLEALKEGKVLENPSMINFFFILSYCDLKKYHFYYWFAFPVPCNLEIVFEASYSILEEFSEEQVLEFGKKYKALDIYQRSYCVFHKDELYPFSEQIRNINSSNYDEYCYVVTDYTFNNNCPKPQFKNFVLFLLHHCPFLGGTTLKLMLFSFDSKSSCRQSTIFKVKVPRNPLSLACNEEESDTVKSFWVGWEKNENNKFGPRFSNMRSTMDPAVLFEESADLNLKLMKWRLLPDIDLEKLKNLKCLLLGAGTLGCSVARVLLGWGVRNITFVDNATVSFSNPVRQSLYTYEDSINCKRKAEAAAESLRKIFPSINAQGYNFTIPMPGHSVSSSNLESLKKDVDMLESFIQGSDIVFLLMDSRESRWLPTLLAVIHEKMVINVALGFDTYLIMRYGGKANPNSSNNDLQLPEGIKGIHGSNLGCYFCNDVTAPGNSLKDRTLDQQCTVTRPGLSSIAGALAVELAVSVVQHEKGMDAPAFYSVKPGCSPELVSEKNESILGILPHSIRGFLSSFTHVLPATPKYDHCIGCSEAVLKEYTEKGFVFLVNVFNSSKYLEDLTGLTELQNEENYVDVLELTDEELSDN